MTVQFYECCLMGDEALLTLFVLDDVLVLLVHDGATEAVLGPGKES